MGRWLRGPLRDLMNDALGTSAARDSGIFDQQQVERLKREHLTGARKHSKLLFSLLMFHLWSEGQRSRRAAASEAVVPATFVA